MIAHRGEPVDVLGRPGGGLVGPATLGQPPGHRSGKRADAQASRYLVGPATPGHPPGQASGGGMTP